MYVLISRTFNRILLFQSNLSRGDTDDTDEDDGELRHRRHSHSPSAHVNGNRHLADRFFNDKVQIISSSGGNIIAVTNPALLMSATTTTTPPPLSLKIEPVSPTRDDDWWKKCKGRRSVLLPWAWDLRLSRCFLLVIIIYYRFLLVVTRIYWYLFFFPVI